MAQVAALRRPVISPPEPGLTPAELVARAVALRPLLRAQQDENDARGTYSEELHQAFLKAGFYRITQPRLFGGYEFDLATFYRVMLEISRGHPGVGWCLALAASHAFEVASPVAGAGAARTVRCRRVISSRRTARRPRNVDAGRRRLHRQRHVGLLLGHSLRDPLHRRRGDQARRSCTAVGHAVVPRSQYTILDDWGGDRVLGMCASGSNSVRIENVFVPTHHVGFLTPGLGSSPDNMEAGTPGTRLHGNPMYLGRLAGPFHATLVVPVVGAARAALDEFEEIITDAEALSMPQIPRFEHFDFQRPFGQALTLTDAAEP